MAASAESKTQEHKKPQDKDSHHVNPLIYAAGASRVSGIIWGLAASIVGYTAVYLGLRNPKSADMAAKASKAITLPEHEIKKFMSKLTNSPPPPPNTGKNAPLTAAIAFGFIMNHLAQIPYFEAARRKVTRINAECDTVRNENEMLTRENMQLKEAVPIPVVADREQAGIGEAGGTKEAASPKSFRDTVPSKNASGFAEEVVKSQNEAREAPAQPSV